jgi:hypothetical protein
MLFYRKFKLDSKARLKSETECANVLAVIAGGTNSLKQYVNSVFQTMDGINFDSMPSIATKTSAQCLAIVDDERLFMTGGGVLDASSIDGPTSKTYLYSKSR